MKQGESPMAWLQFLTQKLDDIQGAIKQREEGQDQPVLTQSSSTESHASILNSRFWFDMYSRLKQEVAKERTEFLDQHGHSQQHHQEELAQARSRLTAMQRDLEQLTGLSQSLTLENQDLRKALSLQHHSSQLRASEEEQAIAYVVEELSSLNRQLKGNALGLVIEKIGEIASGAVVGQVMQGNNKVALVMYEVLAMFEVMMRQLKVTQKELKRAKKR